MYKHKLYKKERAGYVTIEELINADNYLLTYIAEKEVGVFFQDGRLLKLPEFLSILSPAHIRCIVAKLQMQNEIHGFR